MNRMTAVVACLWIVAAPIEAAISQALQDDEATIRSEYLRWQELWTSGRKSRAQSSRAIDTALGSQEQFYKHIKITAPKLSDAGETCRFAILGKKHSMIDISKGRTADADIPGTDELVRECDDALKGTKP